MQPTKEPDNSKNIKTILRLAGHGMEWIPYTLLPMTFSTQMYETYDRTHLAEIVKKQSWRGTVVPYNSILSTLVRRGILNYAT